MSLLDKADISEQTAHERRTETGTVECLHFVRFDDNHGQQFWNAVRAFGPPHFLHRNWDHRARREIADGDTVVFAKGDENQPVSPFNGDDEYYCSLGVPVRA